MMGSFSIWHWIVVLLLALTLTWPTARILRRAGLSRWWVILALIPWVNLAALWVFAFVRWPAVDGSATKELTKTFD